MTDLSTLPSQPQVRASYFADPHPSPLARPPSFLSDLPSTPTTKLSSQRTWRDPYEDWKPTKEHWWDRAMGRVLQVLCR